ncbi:HNH endonuclease [Amycolatopsis sp. YIM 10]|uniref:HNH endonuclease n=1 Tax=Amycolatopsis sp. YIM 10 TaxID=2653857 RepID=UPI00128FEC33|nr:HNH endonuclease signature motif containing protein [Amycolatopsis sp. YIM 10]QFU87845.1 hypothetical protein YIM_13295 [Amycolatopsis sp. YIM 10]QFU94842.1 hypothetical protein YIM_48585 [Amycolatopsis sp. YIM 10]
MTAQQVSEDVRATIWTRSAGICEKCGRAAATEVHHRCGRKMGGTVRRWINLPANLLHLCSPCHEFVTNTRGQRAFIETMGWLVREGIRLPSEIPVLLARGLVLLRDDGDVEFVPPGTARAKSIEEALS